MLPVVAESREYVGVLLPFATKSVDVAPLTGTRQTCFATIDETPMYSVTPSNQRSVFSQLAKT